MSEQQRRHINAEIHENQHEYIIDFKDMEYKVWSNLDGDEIVCQKPFEIPKWVKDQLTTQEVEKIRSGHIVEIEVPFEEIDYEIRDRETGRMVKRPSVKNLYQGTYNHFRGEGGEIIEPDHPESPLSKLGMI